MMKSITTAIMIVFLTVSAHAQGMGSRGGKRHQQDVHKSEAKAKNKVDQKAYQDALKSIPNSNEKSDPWKRMRQS
jgi:hypothetical protein